MEGEVNEFVAAATSLSGHSEQRPPLQCGRKSLSLLLSMYLLLPLTTIS